jgi:hypothetical protein
MITRRNLLATTLVPAQQLTRTGPRGAVLRRQRGLGSLRNVRLPSDRKRLRQVAATSREPWGRDTRFRNLHPCRARSVTRYGNVSVVINLPQSKVVPLEG